jgi:hypothetical protein
MTSNEATTAQIN